MYAYAELSKIARTDSIIQSLSWMHYLPTPSSSLNVSNDETNTNSDDDNNRTATTITQPSINLCDGWLATGNTNHIVSVTYTSIRSDENLSLPDRTNFNLRAHRTEVRLVSWNAPFQKLATVDEKGVIFVWVKHDNRWSLELINDRSHPVIDMAWSHDGRMTVICYEDGFVLVGSVTGQRYWSTVVNTAQSKISAVTWMPDVSHVILGTTGGHLILMDHHGNTTDGFTLSTQSILQLAYSCNKFYPGAPDNSNASKFVNDDYILACSLENGDILLLNNYQDQSPISVKTGLQNVKIDWSWPGEILAVGGHICSADSNFTNQIIFYTRHGEFLCRIYIPQTTHALTALCWAHGNDRLFAACGSYVYTVWVTHKPLPSMLTLCQMKIKEHLLNNSLQNIDKLFLPNNLKHNLENFYRSTIKGFLPDQRLLRSFVSNPLKSHLRLQCTMKRVDNEPDGSANIPASNLSGATYVLYLEYLGGLIPLLTAKRVSKICPDFIIFDPQTKSNRQALSSKVSSGKQQLTSVKVRSNTFHNMSSTQTKSSNDNNSNNRTSLITNRNSIYVIDNGVNNNGDDFRTNKSSSGCSSDNDSDADEDQKYDGHNDDVQEKSSKKSTTKYKHNNKLCTIAANIWGTRFKFYGHSKNLPDVLGSVTYKTSFLHLQPRQMTVTVANNYNARKRRQSSKEKKKKELIDVSARKTKQHVHNKLDDEDDDETLTALSSSKLNIAANIPIAPMSPQLQNAHSSLFRIQQQPSLSVYESRSSTQVKNFTHTQTQACSPPYRPQCTPMTATTLTSPCHRQQQANVESSTANSSSTSPTNLSRSTSPAASIANFVRPISPPCIQVKEPLSPRLTRTSSRTIANNLTHSRQCSPPLAVPSIANNIDASTASATTTLHIDDSSGYDSSENQNNQTATATVNTIPNSSIVSNVPESCFEPETYRNLYSYNSNRRKSLSLSDPTLNETTTFSQSSQPLTTTDSACLSIPSSQRQISTEDQRDIHSENDDERIDLRENSPSKSKSSNKRNTSRKRYSSARHRMMTCTSAMNDSLTRLSPSSELDQSTNNQDDDSSFYVMQNRPPLWNEQSQVYQLDFGGRVTLESAKNFQIEFKGRQVIQFGRIENNCYTLDFEWPFSPLQAFAVALANITQRLK